MRNRLRILLLCLPLSLFAPSLAAADDASDIQSVIAAQLQAFRSGDGRLAYSYASPEIQRLFPSSDSFMSMVRSGYAVVADARHVTFGPMMPEGRGFRQDVNMTDAEGRNYVASYTLERQADGTLKITSCSIRKSEAVSA